MNSELQMGACSSSPDDDASSLGSAPSQFTCIDCEGVGLADTEYLRPDHSTGKCLRVVSGDSFIFAGTLGGKQYRFFCVMLGYSCHKADLDAADALKQQIEDKVVDIHIHSHDGYGRLVVSVDCDHNNVNQAMLALGIGTPHDV